MGYFKKQQQALEEDLANDRLYLDELEAELAYFEHEVYSLQKRIELQKDLIHAKEYDIQRKIQELTLTFEDRL